MEKSLMLIPQIHTDTRRWTARITITEDIPVMTCSGGSDLKLKRYVFTDAEGNQIAASVFGDLIKVYSPVLQLYKVYEISSAQVKFVHQQYRVVNYPDQWILQRYTLIRPMPEERPNLDHVLDGLTPINQIPNAFENGMQSVDIMGVVIKAGPCKNVTVDSNPTTVQNFEILDADLKTIEMSVWGEMTSTIAPLLVEAANNNDVLLARRLKITKYGVIISLRAKNGTSFAFNPQVESAMNMKSWFQTVRDDVLPQVLGGKSITKYRDLVYDGSMKIHTVSELQDKTEVGDYWIRGFLQIHDINQKLYYIGCGNCFSKIDEDPGVGYECHFCRKKVVTQMRPFVVMSVTDNTGSFEVVAMGNVAERIMQTTPEHIVELKQMGATYDLNSVRTDFENRVFLILLHQSVKEKAAIQRRPLLVAYHDEVLSDKGKAKDQTLSPLKRQMNQMSICPESTSKRQLIMMPADEHTHEESTVVEGPETGTLDD